MSSELQIEAPPAAHSSVAAAAEAKGNCGSTCDGESSVIRISDLGKCYRIFNRPHDRLKQALFGRRRTFYHDFWALQGASFSVGRGETLGIIGRNGSGKSTLLQIICGTLAPTTGRVETAGRVAALLELGAGFHPEFTGRENIYLNARILGLTRSETESRFDRIAAFAEIGEFLDRPVKTYSSGMYVRLAFSVIANVDADILVIDEALAVGDALFRQKCMRFLRGFREHGTVLFVSHDAASVLSLCDRALWLEDGRIRQIGPAKEVNDAYFGAWFGQVNRSRRELTTEQGGEGGPVSERAAPLRKESVPVAPLSSTAEAFGEGGATILGIDLLDDHDKPVRNLAGRQNVRLRIHFRARQRLAQPITGFFVKDRLGQNLFGQNTISVYGDQPPPMESGEERVACFAFEMPLLQPGDFTITAAIAEGTLANHTQHHWVYDAYVFSIGRRQPSPTGLVGIAMQRVEFCEWSPERG